jgi:succinoglycan biosynthesis transport protein ExoP
MAVESISEDDVRIDMGAVVGLVWARKWRIFLVTILLLAATYALLQFVPRMYESSASILVESRDNAFTRIQGEEAPSSSASDPAVMSSQIELIKSRDTLLKVIESENLRAVPEFTTPPMSPIGMILGLFGRGGGSGANVDEVVIQNLNDRLTVIRERDSALISVLVRTRDPQLSARVANAIANAHVQRRVDLSVSDTAEATVWLQGEIEKLRVLVKDAEDAVAAYKVDNDLFQGSNDTSLLDQQLTNLSTQISAAQERRGAAESRATLIRSLVDAGQPIEGVTDVQSSVIVQNLSQTKATLQGERAQASATLLPNHPTVRALDAQIAEINAQITQEARRVADALETEARIEAQTEASLRDDLTRAKMSASDATRNNVQLAALEREAAAQRGLLETYLARYRDAASRVDSQSALPDVRVVTLAAPGVNPVSPQVTLTLAAVGIVSLFVQVGAVIFGELVSGRALVRRTRVETVSRPVPEPADDDRPPAPDASPDIRYAEAAHDAPARRQAGALPQRDGDADPDFDNARQSARWAAQDPADLLYADDQPQEEADIGWDDQVAADEALDAPLPEFDPEPAWGPDPDLDLHFDDLVDPPAEPDLFGDLPARNEALANLSADITLGRARVVLLVSLGQHGQSVLLSDRLVSDAVRHGVSVVRIDAGSGRPSTELGISDLAAGYAGFGDIVHKGIDRGVSEVPWGQQSALNRRSAKPLTLVEALTDLYEAVFVLTGRMGMASALPVFAGVHGRLVLVCDDDVPQSLIEAAQADAAALGFTDVELVAPPVNRAEVA